MTPNPARCIAANIAKLPGLLRKDFGAPPMPVRRRPRRYLGPSRHGKRMEVPPPSNALGFGNDACVSRAITKGSIQ